MWCCCCKQDHVVPAYTHLIQASEPMLVKEAQDQLIKALAAVDEFLALHGVGEDYAVGPHYGWSMSSQGGGDQVGTT
jgi:hypothetical protein